MSSVMAVTTKAHALDSVRGPRSKHWSTSSTLPSTATALPLPNQAWPKVRFKLKCPSEPQRSFLLAIPELVQRQSLAARRLGIVHANLRCAIKARDSLAKSSRLNKTPPPAQTNGECQILLSCTEGRSKVSGQASLSRTVQMPSTFSMQ